MTIALDTRYRALVHYQQFLPSLRAVARIYGVSKSALQRWTKKGLVQRRVRAKRELKKQLADCVRRCLDNNPMQTMESLQREVAQRCGLKRSVRTMGRAVSRAGYSLKKVFRCVSSEPDADRVTDFCTAVQGCNADRIVWIDEAGFYVGDHATRGYSPVGKRLRVAAAKSLRRIKMTLLMAVTSSGVVHHTVMDHNCCKQDFCKFISELSLPENTMLVMDNLQVHKSAEAMAAYKQIKCQAVFIPPYSPRFNAIEYAFSLMKRMYRKECPFLQSSCTTGALDRSAYEELLHAVVLFPHDLRPFVARTLATAQAAYRSGGACVQTHD